MNYKKYNDYELIYMVRENDEDSKMILFQKYSPILRKIASEYYQSFSNYGYDYEDFVQEATIAFQRALCAYDESKNNLFYTFVIVCVRRSLLSFCRNMTASGREGTMVSSLEFNEYPIEDEKSDMNRIFQDYEMEMLCKKVIFDLPLEAGAILELKINGFSYREIGTLLDIPSSSVEFKSRKARKLIRKAFQNYYCK